MINTRIGDGGLYTLNNDVKELLNTRNFHIVDTDIKVEHDYIYRLNTYGIYLFIMKNDYEEGCMDLVECGSVKNTPLCTRIKGTDYFVLKGISKFELQYTVGNATGYLSVYKLG